MAYVVARVFFFGVITFVTVCTVVVTTPERSHDNGILFKEVVVSKKSWRWNYTPRREYPYINAESKM
jgi:hypothetical protein